VLTGPDGISLFVLFLFGFKNYKRRIILYKLKHIKATYFTGGILALYIAMVIGWYFTVSSSMLLISSAIHTLFGLISGLALFLHHQYIQGIIKRSSEAFPTYHDLPSPEEMSLAMIVQNELKRFNHTMSEDLAQNEIDTYFDYSEDRLNEILDKINERGESSLLPEEREFLHGYSKMK
jgi:hypothetical protein